MQSLLQDPKYAVRSSCHMVSMCRGHGCCHCAMWVLHSLVAPYGVLRLQLLCHVGCHGCGCCTAQGVVVAVVAPRSVSRLQLLCCVGCRGCDCCTMWGVAVTIFVPCVVLGRHLCAMCSVRSPSLRCMWCCGRGCCTTGGVVVVAPRAVLRLLRRIGCC